MTPLWHTVSSVRNSHSKPVPLTEKCPEPSLLRPCWSMSHVSFAVVVVGAATGASPPDVWRTVADRLVELRPVRAAVQVFLLDVRALVGIERLLRGGCGAALEVRLRRRRVLHLRRAARRLLVLRLVHVREVRPVRRRLDDVRRL